MLSTSYVKQLSNKHLDVYNLPLTRLTEHSKMGKPAARISDNHSCPKTTSKVPHVGGPIVTGSGNVFIGGMPAARKGDKLICIGPPDSISEGSATVFINGKPAARMGDSTSHGGVIFTGMPTVLIGDSSHSVSGGENSATSDSQNTQELASIPQAPMPPKTDNTSPEGNTSASQHSTASSSMSTKDKGIGLALKDQYGCAYSRCRYEVKGSANQTEGVTTGTGIIDLEEYKDEQEVEVRFWPDKSDDENYRKMKVKVQQLEVIDTPTGLQQRLANLSLLSGKVDGHLGHKTRKDLKELQFDRDIEISGDVDEETKAWIEKNEKLK